MVEPRSISYSPDRWLTDSRVYNLIWLGRWLERAENIARVVNTAAQSAINKGKDAAAFQQDLALAATARGIVIENPDRIASVLLRDHPASSIYHSMCTARSNATHVGSLELIRAITDVVLGLENGIESPVSPDDAKKITAAVLEGLDEVYKIINDSWFHREPLSEEEVYLRFTQ